MLQHKSKLARSASAAETPYTSSCSETMAALLQVALSDCGKMRISVGGGGKAEQEEESVMLWS